MRQYLATTGISEIWDLENNPLLLGPWCLTDKRNKELVAHKDYTLVSSPWRPPLKIKEAADYCHKVYEELLPQLSEKLNFIHHVSYSQRYWQVLIGTWLLHFIGVFYDRYRRIENALKIFPDFYTHALPIKQCIPASLDMYDFLYKINEDYYNLKLFSIINYDLCPHNIIEKDYKSESKIHMNKYSWKRKLFNKLMNPLNTPFRGSMILSNMHRLTEFEKFLFRHKKGFDNTGFMNFKPFKNSYLKNKYSNELRKALILNGSCDRFQSLLYKTLPDAIPICYMENYNFYKSCITNINDTESVKIIGSVFGWIFDDEFKFFAAEELVKGARLFDFQHGGNYGFSLSCPMETLSLEKDIFYTWGWYSKSNNTKPLPSPHLSKIKDKHSPRLNKILFVNSSILRYHYRFHTLLLPDDMSKYFEDKRTFFQNLTEEVRSKVLWRPSIHEYEWGGEAAVVREVCPNVNYVRKGSLVDWMKKTKLVVIDHPHTSFLEALAINVPCILYWDHEINLMRPEAERYFELLRNARVLFEDPVSAAKRLNEVFDDAICWWRSEEVQQARREFCEHFGYARKDWMKIWAEEFRRIHTDLNKYDK